MPSGEGVHSEGCATTNKKEFSVHYFEQMRRESHASLVYGTSLDDAVSGHADDLGSVDGSGLHQGAEKRLKPVGGEL